jgi:uncharacterized membrane protein YgdD (TMEM256/DUF423 family)
MKALAMITAISGFMAVALGAFGAHALRAIAPPEMLAIWQTAMQYQMFHALILMCIVIAGSRTPNKLLCIAGWMFVVGTVLFSGSLYTVVITGIKALGMITPIGGVLFLGGWLVLAFAMVKFVAAEQAES